MQYPVLLTRERSKAEGFRDQLIAAGLDADQVYVSPTMGIEYVPIDLPEFECAVLTSGHGVSALPKGFDAAGRSALCVGQRTTAAAQARGFDAECAGPKAQDLLTRLLESPMEKALYLRGEHVSLDLAALVQNLKQAVIYRQPAQDLTVSAKNLLDGGTPVVLPLFSARSAAYLVDQLTDVGAHVAVCISETVGALCRARGFKAILISSQPNANAMADAVYKAAYREV